MALTVKVIRRTKMTGLNVVIADATFDSSYATGGEDMAPSALGLQVIDHIDPEISSGGYVVRFSRANKKLQAFQGDNTNAAAAPLVEVANTTNLSAVTVRLVAMGL